MTRVSPSTAWPSSNCQWFSTISSCRTFSNSNKIRALKEYVSHQVALERELQNAYLLMRKTISNAQSMSPHHQHCDQCLSLPLLPLCQKHLEQGSSCTKPTVFMARWGAMLMNETCRRQWPHITLMFSRPSTHPVHHAVLHDRGQKHTMSLKNDITL